MPSEKPSEETLRKMLELQWLDHFQTRAQTWKALEITALIAIALVGLDWRVGHPVVTGAAAILLFFVAQFGVLITLRHRTVEINKFRSIISLEEQLGISVKEFRVPESISWWSIFRIHKSNTPLFILRMYFIIQLFAVGYLAFRLLRM